MVAKSTITTRVRALLSTVSNITPPAKIKLTDRLKQDLLLSSAMVNALAQPYTLISRDYGGRHITIAEASELTTVQVSVDLVHARANTAP